MKQQSRRIVIGFLILTAALVGMLYWNINTGSVHLTPAQMLRLLVGGDDGSLEGRILWRIRLPRLLGAAVLGGGLSIAGFLLQTFFKNPIAGPFVLGISSGSRLFVGFFMLAAFPLTQGGYSPYTIFLAAFVGAMVSMLLVLTASGRVSSLAVLLVIGMMVGYICDAGTDFMITFADSRNLTNFTVWSRGSFSGIGWEILTAACWIVFPAVGCAFLLSKPLGAYLLGESYAQSMGVDVKRFRAALIVLSSVLAACVTAFAGPVSFVGIAVPHITRLLFRTSQPVVLLPAVFLTGSVFCLLCDLIARTAFAPTEMTLSTVTAVLGAPVVVGLMLRRKGDTFS